MNVLSLCQECIMAYLSIFASIALEISLLDCLFFYAKSILGNRNLLTFQRDLQLSIFSNLTSRDINFLRNIHKFLSYSTSPYSRREAQSSRAPVTRANVICKMEPKNLLCPKYGTCFITPLWSLALRWFLDFWKIFAFLSQNKVILRVNIKRTSNFP